MKIQRKRLSKLQRFEKAKAAILAAAINPTTKSGDTFVTMKQVADFHGVAVQTVSNYRKWMGVVSIKDNNRKSDNGQGLLMISRKIPVSEIGRFKRDTGTHKTLGKHVSNKKVKQQINSVLHFVHANA